MISLYLFLISLIFSFISVWLIKKIALYFKIGSLPSARKIHQGFIPVLGGVGIFAGLLIGIIFALLLNLISINDILHAKYFFVGLLIVTITGLIDDIKGLNSTQKFLGEFAAAITVVVAGCMVEAFRSPDGTVLNLGWFAYPFSVVWIVFVINAVNLMDGLDGLAGGTSLLALIGFIIISSIHGNMFLMLVAIAAAGGIIGFLILNRHPASIFMGDVGSLQLGFLLAFFSIEALKVAGSNQVYFLSSLVILGIPITDTLISFFRRLGGGEHPFKADQEHVHHRILNLGLTHPQTVNLIYVLAFIFSLLGVLMVIYEEVAGFLLFFIALTFSIYWTWRLGYLETRSHLTFGIEGLEAPTAIRPQFHWNQLWHQIILFMTDIVSINVALYLTYWFKFQSGIVRPLGIRSIQDYFTTPVFLIFTIGWIMLFWLNEMYNMPWDVSRFDKSVRLSRIITFGTIVLGLITLDFDRPYAPTQLSSLLFYWVAMIVIVNGFRLLIISVEKRFHWLEYSFKNALIIGVNRKAKNVIQDIKSNPHMLYKIVGIVDRKEKNDHFEGYPIVGAYNELPQLIHAHKIEEIIVALSKTSREDLMNIIGICDRLQVIVKTIPELTEIVLGKNSNLAGHFLVRVFPEKMALWQWLIKRAIDIIFSVLMLLILSPLFAVIILYIKLQLNNTTFVKQSILGRNGQVFKMLLFRLVSANLPDDFDYRNRVKDKKLNNFSKLLYEKNLYKLPQVINILKGDMSLVGPRPESIDWYRENQNRFRFLHRRILIRPGITGLAQVKYRYESTPKLLQEKIKYDIYYIENISINLDLRIILRSILLFFFKKKSK